MSAHKEQQLLCNSVIVFSDAIILSLNCFSLPKKKWKASLFPGIQRKDYCMYYKKENLTSMSLHCQDY